MTASNGHNSVKSDQPLPPNCHPPLMMSDVVPSDTDRIMAEFGKLHMQIEGLNERLGTLQQGVSKILKEGVSRKRVGRPATTGLG